MEKFDPDDFWRMCLVAILVFLIGCWIDVSVCKTNLEHTGMQIITIIAVGLCANNWAKNHSV